MQVADTSSNVTWTVAIHSTKIQSKIEAAMRASSETSAVVEVGASGKSSRVEGGDAGNSSDVNFDATYPFNRIVYDLEK